MRKGRQGRAHQLEAEAERKAEMLPIALIDAVGMGEEQSLESPTHGWLPGGLAGSLIAGAKLAVIRRAFVPFSQHKLRFCGILSRYLPNVWDMDATDRRILAELQPDATLSLDRLAERVGLSRNACWRRIRQLEDDGTIRGRATLLDPERINVGLTVFIAIRTNEHSQEWLDQFRAAITDIPEIMGVFRMSGDIDYLMQAVVPDVAAYDRLYRRIIARVKLSDVSSSFVMEKIKSTTVLPLDYAADQRR